MFPYPYRLKALHYGESEEKKLQTQERTYAQAYLRSIGREAEIGEYGDFDVILLTDCGISVEVSNALLDDERLWNYPYWIGSSETLENGSRYIHTLSVDETNHTIHYVTKEYDTGKIMERFVFDAETGEEFAENC